MVQSMNDNDPLSGVRVLVVEDDTLLAMDLKETLVDAGAIVVDVCLAEWSDRPIVEKPAPSRVLVSALRDALSR